MNNRVILIGGVLAGILLIAVLPRFFGGEEEPGVVTEEVVSPIPGSQRPEPAPPRPSPEPVSVPVPVQSSGPEQAAVEPALPEAIELPALNDSDAFVLEQVAGLENGTDILQQLSTGQTVRKFVTLIDNMGRGDLPVRDFPALGPRSDIKVSERGDELFVMEPASYARFDEIVDTFTSVRTEDAVAMLALFAPLLESAYAELGYPDSSFGAVLEQAIDNVLNAPQVADEQIFLVRPSVVYEFANPQIEELSSVEKLMIRMGPDNAVKVQDKVREIRDAVRAVE